MRFLRFSSPCCSLQGWAASPLKAQEPDKSDTSPESPGNLVPYDTPPDFQPVPGS